jgi:hypothetical protein
MFNGNAVKWSRFRYAQTSYVGFPSISNRDRMKENRHGILSKRELRMLPQAVNANAVHALRASDLPPGYGGE